MPEAAPVMSAVLPVRSIVNMALLPETTMPGR
jgi:hypothetical protein